MPYLMVAASHSPLLDFPARESPSVVNIRAALDATRARIEAFDPDLVILFGVDHYGGQHMDCMSSFCVGVEATALADVGGTPGRLDVPRDLAVAAVRAIRASGVDTAVSFAMDVDHGFSQALTRLLGGVDRYPVLPIFVNCIQPPFSPYARARALGAAVGEFARGLGDRRILFLGSGGLAHNPAALFPPIDAVQPEWRPYILHGKAQADVPQQAWIDYEIQAHRMGAQMLAQDQVTPEMAGLKDAWDKAFLATFCGGDLSVFDGWDPEQVMDEAGIGAVETQSWVAAGQAMLTASGAAPRAIFQEVSKEVGIGFGIAEAGPA
ncbi:3-carboxyethylcatechol 2,3-dioxygenase [Phenylobacterium kunshanense]|uniref:3-carboxyethylcatechol 2,3-dioxygenase n=1 Tax=Phenylobacterium kunshanense TaxID=1445034 RepID=A0A328B9R2_9CAUL|nr:3-carboxyethylcatechol 2,3-dioxygenase [Phenylobacterium kunshanense]RAK62464.1 3-carboxyethylcatechol 2,3-dioxygenase [Phenylobacterium kunshanense]